jgi:hypothetical protein
MTRRATSVCSIFSAGPRRPVPTERDRCGQVAHPGRGGRVRRQLRRGSRRRPSEADVDPFLVRAGPVDRSLVHRRLRRQPNGPSHAPTSRRSSQLRVRRDCAGVMPRRERVAAFSPAGGQPLAGRSHPALLPGARRNVKPRLEARRHTAARAQQRIRDTLIGVLARAFRALPCRQPGCDIQRIPAVAPDADAIGLWNVAR